MGNSVTCRFNGNIFHAGEMDAVSILSIHGHWGAGLVLQHISVETEWNRPGFVRSV